MNEYHGYSNTTTYALRLFGAAILGSILFSPLGLLGQNKYWVSFRDKAGTSFCPETYFSKRALQQRTSRVNSSADSTDYPVSSDYVDALIPLVDSISWTSRWLNGVAVYTSEKGAGKISRLDCVSGVEPMMNTGRISATKKLTREVLRTEEGALLKYQTERLQAGLFEKKGLDGTGICIAVFDVGFPGVDKHPAFEEMRRKGKIKATYDFVAHKENVYAHHWHGTATLSCIGGRAGEQPIGLASGADILLARTEHAVAEPFSEEENWLAAAEWADRQGANIISSSLGYTNERYFNEDMNGRTSLVARAATIAARKGILVVNAAGNEGGGSWRFVDTPGDADSILTVGGTDPASDMHIYFSSFGPTSDGRMKPNVCAPAKAIVAKARGYAVEFGTSFSTPLVAGFAACAWQARRNFNNMQLLQAIQQSAHLYPYFDYAHGFGIPQASRFTGDTTHQEPTFDFVIVNDEIKVVLRQKYSYPSTELALGFSSQRNLYYKVESKTGGMRSYTVLLAETKEALTFRAGDYTEGDAITVHFEGYTSTIDFPGNNGFLPEHNNHQQ